MDTKIFRTLCRCDMCGFKGRPAYARKVAKQTRTLEYIVRENPGDYPRDSEGVES